MSRYQLFPQKISIAQIILNNLWKSIIGLIGFGILCFIVFWLFYIFFSSAGFAIGAPLILFLVAGWVVSKTWGKIYKEIKIEKKQDRANLKRLTSELNKTIEDSIQIEKNLLQKLSKASRALDNADYEYGQRAFAPFWDAIEQAANYLYSFNDDIKQLSTNIKIYTNSLKDRDHNFPVKIVNGRFPDPRPVVNRLHNVVRKAQKDFQFSTIWEQRQTRKILIAGFHSLKDAINNLEVTIDSSIYNLEESISSNFEVIKFEEMRTQESIEKYGEKITKQLKNRK